MERIFNLTPHDIHLYSMNPPLAIPTSDRYKIPRMISTQTAGSSEIVVNKSISLPVQTHTELNTLQDFEDAFSAGDIIITSMLCAKAIANQLKDKSICVLSPDTTPDSVVRDNKGRIIGVKRFIIYN